MQAAHTSDEQAHLLLGTAAWTAAAWIRACTAAFRAALPASGEAPGHGARHDDGGTADWVAGAAGRIERHTVTPKWRWTGLLILTGGADGGMMGDGGTSFSSPFALAPVSLFSCLFSQCGQSLRQKHTGGPRVSSVRERRESARVKRKRSTGADAAVIDVVAHDVVRQAVANFRKRNFVCGRRRLAGRSRPWLGRRTTALGSNGGQGGRRAVTCRWTVCCLVGGCGCWGAEWAGEPVSECRKLAISPLPTCPLSHQLNLSGLGLVPSYACDPGPGHRLVSATRGAPGRDWTE